MYDVCAWLAQRRRKEERGGGALWACQFVCYRRDVERREQEVGEFALRMSRQ